MRYVTTLALAAVFFFTFALAFGTRPLADNAASTVIISNFAATGHGSGVYIGDGQIVTAAHVAKMADGNGHMKIEDQFGNKVTATVLWFDEASDVGLLKLDLPLKGIVAAPLSCHVAVHIGDRLEAVGSPLNLKYIHTYGRVAGPVAAREGSNKSAAQTNFVADLTVAPGNSGGPVFNHRNDLVGIVVATAVATLGMFPSLVPLTYVVPTSVICQQFASAHEAPKFATPTSEGNNG